MQYDSAIKCISPELSADIATLVLGRKPDLKQISESLPSDERLADFLAKMTGDEEFILHARIPDPLRLEYAGANARVPCTDP